MFLRLAGYLMVAMESLAGGFAPAESLFLLRAIGFRFCADDSRQRLGFNAKELCRGLDSGRVQEIAVRTLSTVSHSKKPGKDQGRCGKRPYRPSILSIPAVPLARARQSVSPRKFHEHRRPGHVL